MTLFFCRLHWLLNPHSKIPTPPQSPTYFVHTPYIYSTVHDVSTFQAMLALSLIAPITLLGIEFRDTIPCWDIVQ